MTQAQRAVQPKPAATVILARNAESGIEIFMMQRSLDSDFVGGAFVFPGGGVDRGDRELYALCVGMTDADASRRLKVEVDGLAYFVAAVRECFEEAGLLLAYDPSGELLSLTDPEKAARFDAYRSALNRSEIGLAEICQREGLRLAVDRMAYYSHWITPEGSHKRFDTRFFVAEAPAGQRGVHDDAETVDHAWLNPQDAVRHAQSGHYKIIFPTLSNIRPLVEFSNTAALMAFACAERDIPAILPRRVRFPDGTVGPVLPGQPGYDTLPASDA